MTREEYLNQGVEVLRPIFEVMGSPLPSNIRVTCGLPSTFKRSGTLGECFPDTDSGDNHFEVFISPTIADPVRVFEVLVQQLCRTTSGAMSYKSNAYVSLLIKMGLTVTGKYHEVTGDASFATKYVDLISELGDYPHAELKLAVHAKQSTRMLKATCDCEGSDPKQQYTVRLTQKWALKGMPICPLCTESMTLGGV